MHEKPSSNWFTHQVIKKQPSKNQIYIKNPPQTHLYLTVSSSFHSVGLTLSFFFMSACYLSADFALCTCHFEASTPPKYSGYFRISSATFVSTMSTFAGVLFVLPFVSTKWRLSCPSSLGLFAMQGSPGITIRSFITYSNLTQKLGAKTG